MNIQTKIGVWCELSSFLYFIISFIIHCYLFLISNYTGDMGGWIPDSGLGPIISPGVGGGFHGTAVINTLFFFLCLYRT